MSAPTPPLLFPEAIDSPGLWSELGKAHGLREKDFRWLAHARLASATLRGQQTPPLRAERVLLNVGNQIPLPLPGAFVLGEMPDDKGLILYTPYDGIRKHHSRQSLKVQLEQRLNDADEQDPLLAFLAEPQRKRLLDAGPVSVTFSIIDGDIFEEQRASLEQGQALNTEDLCAELQAIATLTDMLEAILDNALKPHFGTLRQKNTRVRFRPLASDSARPMELTDRHWPESMSLSEAVLAYYRHQHWPAGRQPAFSNPGRKPAIDDQAVWEDVVKNTSGRLPVLLFRELEGFWDAPSAVGPTRRVFFARVLEDQARCEWMLKREAGILDREQFNTVHQLIRPVSSAARFPVVESVRLWEHAANYVELAGSLMISEPHAFLYTPAQGLQLLEDYEDLKQTLQDKFLARGHEDELFGLLNLDEQNRFLGFDQPKVSGERIVGEIFKILFESIITKQRQNIEYALQVFRHSDGAVNLHALFDKSLDIRSMIHERLLQLDTRGRWSTHPVIAGDRQPSAVLAEKALAAVKTFRSVEDPLINRLASQPMKSRAIQRYWLETMKPDLAHAWFVGINGEARLRRLNATLPAWAEAIVNTVISADRPTRTQREALNGFRPDAYSLTLESPGERHLVRLAHCILLTERGGLDEQHSGFAVLWTPSQGLEVFDSVASVRRQLNRRLLDGTQRLSLLENILASQFQAHQRYTLGPLLFIGGNVLLDRMESGIEHYLDRCEQVRSRITDQTRLERALEQLRGTTINTNLPLAASHAQAIATAQTLPAWLGMAPVMEQKRHVELLEQWYQSVSNDQDYLTGVPTLVSHVEQTLATLLGQRFPGHRLDPREMEITPHLALAGPPQTLVEFALNHINVAQGTGFRVSSKNRQTMPAGLDQGAVTQLLLSLAIPTSFSAKVAGSLSIDTAEGRERKQRFLRQLPWQLMQQAHALKLQQRLCDTAFDYVRQVLDMPDGIARAAAEVPAIACPLSLIKTEGTPAVIVPGMHVFTAGGENREPLVLYAPYDEQVFHEFDDEKSLIAALNVPGHLQNLLLRRLPEAERALFRSLLESTLGQTSEMSLDLRAITGNLLEYLYTDNLKLLTQLLGTQKQSEAQTDWETAKVLLSDEIKQVPGLLPGKLAVIPFLWKAYDEFKDSAEALQDHHWKRALRSFIGGAAQMVMMGLLPQMSAETSIASDAVEQQSTDAAETMAKNMEETITPDRADIEPTSPRRTQLGPFEAREVALEDLVFSPRLGTYRDVSNNRHYAVIEGKVYPVVQKGEAWQLRSPDQSGPMIQISESRQVIISPGQTVHYGQAIRKLAERTTITRLRRNMLNIEAHGMNEIRLKYPQKARELVHAIDLARRYAFYCLHNLVPLTKGIANPRVSLFLEGFFDVPKITAEMLKKIGTAIIPICKALVDPADELLETERFVVGSNKYLPDVIAFVLDGDQKRLVHFTEHFFDQQLDAFKPFMQVPFDVDGHAQASTLIHEFSHQFSRTMDIATLRAREPFCDLISTLTPDGLRLYEDLEFDQSSALSLRTPREQLFAEWNTTLKTWMGIDKIADMQLIYDEVLQLTGAKNLLEARNAFLDRQNPDVRIKVILRNADSVTRLICEIGRQLDPMQSP